MKLERSDIKFPLWRKEVDATLFKDAATQYPKWLCKVWEMNTTNIYFKGQDANVLNGRMTNITVFNCSACSSAVIEPSHFLIAVGLSDNDAYTSLIFSLGSINVNDGLNLITQKSSDKLSLSGTTE